MHFATSFFPRHAFAFKGGGGGSAPAPAYQSPAAAPAPAPTVAAKPPAAVPPVTERTIEVEMASRESKLAAKKRKGMRSTLLAGETGGYQPTAPADEQKKTLLG
jgi:hypothetical protein